VIISILTAVFAVLSAHFAYKLFDSIHNGSISKAVREPFRRPGFAYRTWGEHSYFEDVRQLPAFVKGLFVSICAGRLFGRVRKAAREVRRWPVLLCNVFLWTFVFLLPLLIAAQGVVGLMVYLRLPVPVPEEPSPGHPHYRMFSESYWMSL
jgi:hypothetical protein